MRCEPPEKHHCRAEVSSFIFVGIHTYISYLFEVRDISPHLRPLQFKALLKTATCVFYWACIHVGNKYILYRYVRSVSLALTNLWNRMQKFCMHTDRTLPGPWIDNEYEDDDDLYFSLRYFSWAAARNKGGNGEESRCNRHCSHPLLYIGRHSETERIEVLVRHSRPLVVYNSGCHGWWDFKRYRSCHCRPIRVKVHIEFCHDHHRPLSSIAQFLNSLKVHKIHHILGHASTLKLWTTWGTEHNVVYQLNSVVLFHMNLSLGITSYHWLVQTTI